MNSFRNCIPKVEDHGDLDLHDPDSTETGEGELLSAYWSWGFLVPNCNRGRDTNIDSRDIIPRIPCQEFLPANPPGTYFPFLSMMFPPTFRVAVRPHGDGLDPAALDCLP